MLRKASLPAMQSSVCRSGACPPLGSEHSGQLPIGSDSDPEGYLGWPEPPLLRAWWPWLSSHSHRRRDRRRSRPACWATPDSDQLDAFRPGSGQG